MFHEPLSASGPAGSRDVAAVLERLAGSSRPRYAFMLLNLIAEVAGPDGSAGPWILSEGKRVSLRDWLCDALAPMAVRESRRAALVQRVEAELADRGELPEDPAKRDAAIRREVALRTRAAGKTNLSRAVSELVNAGMLRRHYEGYRVDHQNRGGQRHAVYTLIGASRRLIAPPRDPASGPPPRRPTRQSEFNFTA